MMTAKESIMQLESLSCNNCGAPLQVPPIANFATCNHCGAQLAIHRESSVSYTEKIGQIDERTERMAKQLAELRYHQALEAVDREWDREREKYLVSHKNGRRSQPNVVGGVIGGAIFGVVGVGVLISGSAMGLLIAAIGIGVAVYGVIRAEEYKRAERIYRTRRSRISISDFEESLDRQPTSSGAQATRRPEAEESTTWPGVFGDSDR
jgi:hypothetical protein